MGAEYKNSRRSEQALFFRSNNGARQDTNPIGNSQGLSKLHKSRRKALVIRAHDGEFAHGGVRERAQKPIKSLLPAEPPQKQNERSLRGNLVDISSDLS